MLEFKRKLHFSPQQKAYTFNLTKHIFTNFSVVPKTNKVSYMHTHIFWPKLTFFSPFEITFFWTLYHWNFGMCSKPNLTLPHLLALSDFLTFIFLLYNLVIPLHNRHKSTEQTNEKKVRLCVCAKEKTIRETCFNYFTINNPLWFTHLTSCFG